MDRILIAEAGKAIYEPLLMACRANGWESLTAHTAAEAVRLCRIVRFDLLLIDTVLPDEDGFSLAQRLQPFGIPVLFIAPPLALQDRLRGFALGAAGILEKPPDIPELLARIKSILRRSVYIPKQASIGDVTVYFDKRRVRKNGQEIPLTLTEFLLLEILLRNPDTVLSREKLLEVVWGFGTAGDTRTVDVHIMKLRRKLGLQNEIRAVYKIGYRLNTPKAP